MKPFFSRLIFLLRTPLLGLFLLGWMAPASRLAASPAEEFVAANQLYEQQKYEEAATAYEKVLAAGQVSAPLYFNLGNARFQAGHPGQALAAYRRAEALAPRDADLRANLQFVREKVHNGNPPARAAWEQFVGRLTANEWAVLTSLGLWTLFLALLGGQMKPALQKTLRNVAFGGLAAGVLFGTGLALAARSQVSQQTAVVIQAEAVARLGPFESSKSAFSAPDGLELPVLSRQNGWVQVTDAKGQIGWIADTQVAVVP